MNEFNIPSIDEFDDFLTMKEEEQNIVVNNKYTCMNENCGFVCSPGDKYCQNCGQTRDSANDELDSRYTKVVSNSVRVNYGSKRRININASRDYSSIRYDEIMKFLNNCNKKYSENGGVKIPDSIIKSVTETYTKIIEDTKIVKRSGKKKSLLAYLLFEECVRHGTSRTKSAICKMLGLKTQTYCRGASDYDDIVSDYYNTIYVPEEFRAKDYALRYLTSLNLSNEDVEKYANFVDEIFKFSESKNIGLQLLPISKVAGCIWFIVNKLKLNKQFTATKISEICDGIQKATFNKFNLILVKHQTTHFAEIMNKYF